MIIYEHKETCPAFFVKGALCICEKPRYVYAFLIGVPIALGEHLAGFMVGSETLNADAWHLVGDLIHDLLAIAIISLVEHAPHREHHFRAWGGYTQGILLLGSSGAIFYQFFAIGAQPGTNGWVMLSVGTFAALGNWLRFRVLHPSGKPLTLLWTICKAYFHGSREKVTYIGKLFHAITDIGVSAIAAFSGLLVLTTAITKFDEWFSIGIAVLLIVGAIIVFAFAHRHHDHVR